VAVCYVLEAGGRNEDGTATTVCHIMSSFLVSIRNFLLNLSGFIIRKYRYGATELLSQGFL
jgi:hypothetical protein